MDTQDPSGARVRRGPLTRNAVGGTSTEAFMIIAIATILITRAYLHLTGYPQVGGNSLHIAHALWGGAFMMLALLVGWALLGLGARMFCVVLGGIGFGLFLDEVGKFVTKDNDYFYGPAAEIMYVLVVVLLVLGRVFRDIRPLGAHEAIASAAGIAADGIARGLPRHRRELGLRLVERARTGGIDPATVDAVEGLLLGAEPASERLHLLGRRLPRLIPGFLRSPRWVLVVGWLMVAASFLGMAFGALGVAFGGIFYSDDKVTFELEGLNVASAILLVSAASTFALAAPAMIAYHRTDGIWPLRWLRYAALIFTMLNALVDFATEGFAALINLSIGLFTLAVLSYQLDQRARASAPRAEQLAESADPVG